MFLKGKLLPGVLLMSSMVLLGNEGRSLVTVLLFSGIYLNAAHIPGIPAHPI